MHKQYNTSGYSFWKQMIHVSVGKHFSTLSLFTRLTMSGNKKFTRFIHIERNPRYENRVPSGYDLFLSRERNSRNENNVPNEPDSILSAEEIRIGQLANEVFENPLLREIILDHAIHKMTILTGVQLDRPTICSLRRCRKSWNQTIKEICLKTHRPLYKLVLNKFNSLDGSPYVLMNGKLLSQVTNHFNAIVRNGSGIIPTVSLKIFEQVFRKENHISFTRFLSQFGTKLVEIEVWIPETGGSLPCIFPHFNFPSLRKIIFRPTAFELPNLVNEPQAFNNLPHLLNALLSGAHDLQEFIIPRHSTANNLMHFRYLQLPSSLTKLELGFVLTSEDFELLATTKFPNLAHLDVSLSRRPLTDGVLTRVLENVKITLKTLTVSGHKLNHPYDHHPTVIHFPVMENLVKMFSGSINFDLGGNANNLELCFPKLKELCLCNQTVSSIRKWMRTSVYSTVEDVTISMTNDQGGDVHGLNLETMQCVHQSCPSLRNLSVVVNGVQTCGLKYIFMEMTQLTSLMIMLYPMEPTIETPGSDYWDALLIGAPVEFISALRANPDFCGKVQFDDDTLPGIKNLTQLERLFLADKRGARYIRSENESLVSDLAFTYALMKMPKLESLTMGGKFRPSVEMTLKWQSLGRRIVYSPT